MTTLRVRDNNSFSLQHRFPGMADTDIRTLGFDFNRVLGSETISSAAWTARDTNGNSSSSVISIGTPSNASGVSTATVTAANQGEALVECQITGSGGSKWTARAYLRILADGDRR